MYELVRANDAHLHDLAELVTTTGAYRIAAAQNKLGVSYQDWMIRLVLPPLVKYSWVLLDNTRHDRVVGILICGRLADISGRRDLSCHLSSTIVDELVTPIRDWIHSFAVRPDMEGKGLGKRLFIEAESLARQSNCTENLSLAVWSNDVKAIRLYLSMGMIVSDLVKTKIADFPSLLLMEKTSRFRSYKDLCA
ncbi:GNAT family N-acetyltransferase [Paraburkholderia sp. CNPSo 3274]|uniref:GNAT family N-acetyltransferase n=1 Tax=Paraburkholderia sp. CNPSo 3274 TaxID=2940932 RepID=UPI0020B83BFF|nr:GNAT family N-acetyltransferase [Paraburkholderia sp. CNPSo 3274]MCP3713341.1 GNAT family N-acetyltransferase [Paraburkholderia sp. CNPSo 3274]